MTEFDITYRQIVSDIYRKGLWSFDNTKDQVRTKWADGSPAHYKSLIGYQFRVDNSLSELPVITSRKVPIKDPIRELYWIWFLRSNNVDELKKLGCKFWDEWRMEDGTIGNAYGYQIGKKTFGHESQLHYIINEIKNNPNSRRILTEIWVPEELDKMALTPCVHLTQWSVRGNRLYLEVRQRSCDVALGLVANVLQYAVLHRLVAHECGLEPAEIIWNVHDIHIYDRHIDKLIEQVNKPCKKVKYRIENEFESLESIHDFHPDMIKIITDNPDGEILDKVSYEVAI